MWNLCEISLLFNLTKQNKSARVVMGLVDLPGAKLPPIAHEAVMLGALGVGAGRAAVHTSPAHHRVD